MIDTVRTLAQPYSHYLMSHRDLVIVLMGLVVMWTVGHDLLTRWRIQRLNRDEAGGRTDRCHPCHHERVLIASYTSARYGI